MSSAERSAILSLLDVVEELAQGLANKQMPEPEWADVVTESFTEHRRELREAPL